MRKLSDLQMTRLALDYLYNYGMKAHPTKVWALQDHAENWAAGCGCSWGEGDEARLEVAIENQLPAFRDLYARAPSPMDTNTGGEK